jgi:peptidoglycan/LPS O-acetylase OafA/YrhL
VIRKIFLAYQMKSSAGNAAKLVPNPDATSFSVPHQLHPRVVSHQNEVAVPNWSRRIPALDGLRGIAILLVLMGHAIFQMETSSKFLSRLLDLGHLSWSGVDLFFVLSGFLIGGILLDARESPHYFRTFYVRRAYRIFPLYAALTTVFLIHHLPFHFIPGNLGNFSPLAIPWASYATLTQNFWMVKIGWFGPAAMGVTWSLAVEEQFYLTVPLVIRKVPRNLLVFVMIAVVAAAPLLRIWLLHDLRHGDLACYVLMPCRADALCLGVLAALLVRNKRGWNLLLTNRTALYGITAVLLAGVVFMIHKGYVVNTAPPVNTVGYSWLALFYTFCLLIAVSSRGTAQRLLCQRWLIGLGTIAYCTYLLHVPLVQVGRRLLEPRFSEQTAWLSGGMLGIAATLGIASISWRFFEKPLLRRGHKYKY